MSNPKVNYNLLRETFDTEWIKEVAETYRESVKDIGNAGYFKVNGGPGKYYGRYNEPGSPPVDEIDYFENLLYTPNFAILNFITLNVGWFSNKTIVDFGCGVGVLSVFLDKIGVVCHNYDDLSQTGDSEHNKFIKKINETYGRNIPQVKNDIPSKIDVVVSSSCNGTPSKEFLAADIFLWDDGWIPTSGLKVTDDWEQYKLLHDYAPMMKVISQREFEFEFNLG